MKIEIISDTHNHHNELFIQGGDVLISCGDFSEWGTKEEAKDFLDWIAKQDHKYKIIVPGNHDRYLETKEGLKYTKKFCKNNNIHLLIDSGVKINNINFWGSPVTPRFSYGWAWNRDITENQANARKFRNVPGAIFIAFKMSFFWTYS